MLTSTLSRAFAFTATAAIALGCTTPLVAQVTNIEFRANDPGVLLPGFTTLDLYLDFTGQLSGVQVLTDFTSGTIYQDPFGSDVAPSAGLLTIVPSIEFDTFATFGGFTRETSDTTPSFAGAAINVQDELGLPIDPAREFSEQRIDAAWFPEGGVAILDRNDYPVMRLTVSVDTLGLVHVLASANAELSPVKTFVVPEPAAASLLGGALLLGLKRRRG